jgi:deoxyribodipyrimidine photo-lyase
MRQLLAEGWMPEPVRVIAATFLTETLGIDWRAGAAHFMHLLVDGDVATNQLNWQWIAGTGAGTGSNRDRRPNPAELLDRYDPQCEYVRRWVEELDTARYPRPIIFHNGALGQWRAARPHA